MTTGALAAIHIYPIKACRRIDLVEIQVSSTGLQGDREWQVVTDQGESVTQSRHRVLATVQPEPLAGALRISAPNHGEIEVASCSDDYADSGPDAGEEAASFFSELLGVPSRLMSILGRAGVGAPPATSRRASLVGLAPVLVTNAASLRDLRRRTSKPFGMARFRPNLVLETEDPWAEDTWIEFSIGAAQLVGTIPWPRCSVAQIDQDTAERSTEPARVLRAHRWCDEAKGYPSGLRTALEGSTLFGLGSTIGPVGERMRIGDALAVRRTTEPLLAPPMPA
jgi:uncharacterized protein